MATTKTIDPKEGGLVRFWNWLTETQAWKSVFRHDRPNSDRNRVLIMLSNVFLHLHPVRIRKSGVKLRYTWCMGGLSFFLFLSLTLTGLLLMFYYRPTLEYAYTDIVGLREHVPLGIMREMHRWGAHAMVITVCTHLGCTPNFLAAENKFKCPCHGSSYRMSGVNFEGPAPRPLERARVVLADDGQILVDKSRHFQRELGQWTDPEAFLKA